MKNKTYDFWKRVAMYYLPAIATLVITVFKIWNLKYGEEIGATITAIDTMLGVFLGISSANYNRKGEK